MKRIMFSNVFHPNKIKSIFLDKKGSDGKVIKGYYHAHAYATMGQTSCYDENKLSSMMPGEAAIISYKNDLRGELVILSNVNAAVDYIRRYGTVKYGKGCDGVKTKIGNFVVCYGRKKRVNFAIVNVEVLSTI